MSEINWDAALESISEKAETIRKYTEVFCGGNEWAATIRVKNYPPRIIASFKWKTMDERFAEQHGYGESWALNPPDSELIEVSSTISALAEGCKLRCWKTNGDPGEQRYELRPYYSNYQL